MSFSTRWNTLTHSLDALGASIAPLGLRLLLAWEFGEAGWSKLHGENWFASIQDDFPFPFHLLSSDLNWTLATWAEWVFGAALLFGLGTRFAAGSLMVVTVVAIAAVHWPNDWSTLTELWQGYAITDRGHGNFKLPLIFLVMLLPLALQGGGRLSMDALLGRALARKS